MNIRPRRLRRTPLLREAVAETRLHPTQLIQPHFLHTRADSKPIESMPGIARMGLEPLVDQVGADLDLGLSSVLLFGVHSSEEKDASASAATDLEGLVPSAVRRLRDEFGDRLTILTDVCLCGATTSGHCGVLDENGQVQNDESLPLLVAAATAHAQAGADVVAPSDMMDGRVAAIRAGLDGAGHRNTAILSYSTKFASAFYGPFRDAADSTPQSGDRRSYQLDPRNGREARRESLLDQAEGADILMVKPALSYLDLIRDIALEAQVPVAAYNVSGEYGMVKAASAKGWVDEGAVVREILTSIARAGADLIISYHSRDALRQGWIS